METKQNKFKEEEPIEEMVKIKRRRRLPRRRSLRRKSSEPYIDGMGLIILVVGIFMMILSVNGSSFSTGSFVGLIGFLRILYVLWRSQ